MKSILPLLFLFGACSTVVTPYQAEKKSEGYSDSKLKEFDTAIFRANSSTKKDITRTYAEFRAVERCRSEKKHADMLDLMDKSVSKEVRKSSSSSFGPSGFGMYPHYSRYSTIGFGVGYNTIDTDSWNETYLYPVMEVIYTCESKVFRPGLVFRELTADQMRDLVKDVRGGLQIEEISPAGGNSKILEHGDIIIKAENQRIEHVYQLLGFFKENHQKVNVELFRDGKRMKLKVQSKDVTDDIIKRENEIISTVCSSEGKPKKNSLCL